MQSQEGDGVSRDADGDEVELTLHRHCDAVSGRSWDATGDGVGGMFDRREQTGVVSRTRTETGSDANGDAVGLDV